MPALDHPLAQELAAFQTSISAPTEFAAVSDIIPAAGTNPCIHADSETNNRLKGRSPLSFQKLKEFCKDFDLRKFGIGRSDVVCTAMPNGAEAAVCFWAISEQCVFAPLNPALTIAEVDFELEDLPCHTMILLSTDTSSSIAGIEDACKKRNVNVLRLVPDPKTVGLFTLKGSAPAAAAADKVNAEHLALVLHTSGTTKKPKIVPLTHSNLGHGIQFVASTLRRQKEDLCLNVMPLFHIHGLIANVGASIYSESQVICSAFRGGEDFLQSLKGPSKRPSWYSAVPTMHEAILLEAEKKEAGTLDHSLTLMRNCSAALLPPVSKRFLKTFGDDLGKKFTVVPTYAMTESFPICSNPPHLEIKLSTVGPAMGPTIKILDGHPNDTELPQGTEGEVCVCGPCVTHGYLMREHMSQDPNIEAFSKETSSVGKMLRTGDKGYLDAEGYLQLVGRFKEIINVGGEKVSPLDMEDQLLSVPGVETCVCFACPADLLGEVVGCAVVPKAGAATPPTLKDIKDGLPGVPVRFKPRILVLMEAIPKGPTGKPKRIGLAKMLNIPAVDQSEEASYKVSGKATNDKGDGLGELTYTSEETGADTLVWNFPLTITLDISPDLDETQHTLHKLIVEDSTLTKWTLTVTSYACGEPVECEFSMPKEEVREALVYLKTRTERYGTKWVAKCGERGRHEDWCGEITMNDGKKSLSQYWPNGCSDTPPGKLMRLLKVLECGIGLDNDPNDTNSVWMNKYKSEHNGQLPPSKLEEATGGEAVEVK